MAIDRSKQKSLTGSADAVPTQLGWVNPMTGELLVSIRGLPGAFQWDRKTNSFTKNGKAVNFGKKTVDPTTKVEPKVEEEKVAEVKADAEKKPIKEKKPRKTAKKTAKED